MKIMRSCCSIVGTGVVVLLAAAPVQAEDVYSLTIKDHQFTPAELTIPADTKVKILVKNNDPTPEEFESTELHREKVVAGGGEITVFVGPLSPGSYAFFGDFNPKTASGHIIVK
jgi:hypothetical protein